LISELTSIRGPDLPARRPFLSDQPSRLKEISLKTYEAQSQRFEDLLSLPEVGAKTIRALALIGELLYGASPSFRNPARYIFAHGGKDGHSCPMDREGYFGSIFVKWSTEPRAPRR
jgi:uncharacterized protein